MRQAGELGILQVHLSGGEPTARKDLEEIVEAAVEGWPLHQPHHRRRDADARPPDEARRACGLDHVQLSIQDVDPENADRIAAYKGGIAKKIEVGQLGARSSACR